MINLIGPLWKISALLGIAVLCVLNSSLLGESLWKDTHIPNRPSGKCRTVSGQENWEGKAEGKTPSSPIAIQGN